MYTRPEVVYSALMLKIGLPTGDVYQYTREAFNKLTSIALDLREIGIGVPAIQATPIGPFCRDFGEFIGRVYYTGADKTFLAKILAESFAENFDETTKLYSLVSKG